MPNIKVLIIEDEPVIAQNIKKVLTNMDFMVIGVAYSSVKALDMLASRGPDVVIIDITIKGDMDGIDIANIINKKYKIPFIYLTAHADDLTLDRAKHTLPYGYIVKPFKEQDIVAGLEMAIFKHAKEHQVGYTSVDVINKELDAPLTQKEYAILCDLSDGCTNKQMALKYDNSINTIKYHLKNLFTKLSVSNRTSATRIFREIDGL